MSFAKNNAISLARKNAIMSPIAMPTTSNSFDLSVDPAGRVVLPVQTRRLLGLRAGSKLRLNVVAQRIELTPVPTDTDIELVVSASGRLVLGAAPASSGKNAKPAADAAAAVRAERDGRA
jgi:AbrB family looped-hinge helix DNA binding protein